MFWTLAAIALFAGAVITLFPLLRGRNPWQPAALALAFALPAAGLWLYDGLGTPEGIEVVGDPSPISAGEHAGPGAELERALDALRQKLRQEPDDLEGWLLLARTLKTLREFEEAAAATESAHALAPDDPTIMTELAEAWIFTSPEGRVPERSVALLQRALEAEPGLQKALWLMGVAAAQQGDDAFAVSYWQSLLEQLEPGSNIHDMVSGQVAEAQARMGMAPVMPGTERDADPEPARDGWPGLRLVLDLSDEARGAVPEGAVLYVIVRGPGPAAGPPLGVHRVNGPAFPLELIIDDDDSMMAERLISAEAELQLQARLSLSGSPAAQSGDWQSAARTIAREANDLVVLTIDQPVD